MGYCLKHNPKPNEWVSLPTKECEKCNATFYSRKNCLETELEHVYYIICERYGEEESENISNLANKRLSEKLKELEKEIFYTKQSDNT